MTMNRNLMRGKDQPENLPVTATGEFRENELVVGQQQ